PHNLTVAARGAGRWQIRQGDLPAAITTLERGLAICQGADITLLLPWIESELGYAYALAGRMGEALPLLEQAVEAATAMEMANCQPLRLAYLAEGYLLAGRRQDATEQAVAALALAQQLKERGHAAWTLRLLGEIAAQTDPPEVEQAESYYRQALALADELG